MAELHPVIQSYLTQFITEASLGELQLDQQFEAFATTCVVARHFPDQFDVEELLTGDDDESIDSVAVEGIATDVNALQSFDDVHGGRVLRIAGIHEAGRQAEQGRIHGNGHGLRRLFGKILEVREHQPWIRRSEG